MGLFNNALGVVRPGTPLAKYEDWLIPPGVRPERKFDSLGVSPVFRKLLANWL